MAQLVAQFACSSIHSRTIYLAKAKSIETIDSDEDWNDIHDNGFLLQEEFAAFRDIASGSQGTYWIKVLSSDETVVSEGMLQALVVPFYVPSDGSLYIRGDRDYIPISIEPGHYNILFELRYMTEEEIARVPEYAEIYLPIEFEEIRPQLYQFTFIPSDGKSLPKRLL